MTPVRAAVRRMVDVCIVDDELEAAFIKDSARSDMAKYRYGVMFAFACLLGVLCVLFFGREALHVLGPATNLLCGLAYIAWLLATCTGAVLVRRVEHCTLEAYSARMRWAATIGYFSCVAVGCWLALMLEQVAYGTHAQCAGLMNQSHVLALFIGGWFVFVVNIVCTFFCFLSSQRTQAGALIASWVFGIAAAIVSNRNRDSKAFLVSFTILHSLCCLGVLVAFIAFGKMRRQAFLYARTLLAEVQSEREKQAEARAVGEKAVCAWVCHEVHWHTWAPHMFAPHGLLLSLWDVCCRFATR
jgi:hypothetical protein